MKKNKNTSAKKLSLKKIEITKLNKLTLIKGGNTSAAAATATQTGNNNGHIGTQSGLNPICTGTRQYL